MRKMAITISLAAATALPISAAQANSSSATKAARQACRTERQQIGSKAFRAKYGPREAMRNCILQHGGQLGNPGEGDGHRGQHDQGRHRGRHHGDNGNHKGHKDHGNSHKDHGNAHKDHGNGRQGGRD